MAANTGCKAALYLGSDKVAKLTSVSYSINGESLEITSFDSNCTKEFIQGLTGMTIDMSGHYEATDTTGQVAMLTAMLAKTTLENTQKPKVLNDGVNGIEADAIVTSISIGSEVAGVTSFTASLQCTGTISVV